MKHKTKNYYKSFGIHKAILVFFITLSLIFYNEYSIFASEYITLTKDNSKQQNASKEGINLTSKSAILMEASMGTVLYEKDADKKLPPASVTKIMTLLLALEKIDSNKMDLDDIVTISKHAASMGGSQCFFEEGEEQTVDDILKCIEVSSGNDAAVAMAEHISGTEEGFVALMNERAKELNMNNTTFQNACGLNAKNHLTTARDISIMSKELVTKHKKILDYSTIWMDSIIHKTNKGEKRFDLANTNKFLKQYNGAVGLKTGYTSEAKYCISAVATRNNITLIAVILGADTKEIRNAEASKLLDYGFSKCNLYEDKENISLDLKFKVKNGTKNYVTCKEQENISIVQTNDTDSKIEKKVVMNNKLKAPIFENDIIGSIQYVKDGKLLKEQMLYASENVYKKTYFYVLKHLSNKIFMLK